MGKQLGTTGTGSPSAPSTPWAVQRAFQRGLNLHTPIQQCGSARCWAKTKILSNKINLKLSQCAGWWWGCPSTASSLRPEIRCDMKSLYMVHVLNWRQIFWPAPWLLQVLKDQMKDKQQGPFSSEEVVDVGDHWWCTQLSWHCHCWGVMHWNQRAIW